MSVCSVDLFQGVKREKVRDMKMVLTVVVDGGSVVCLKW